MDTSETETRVVKLKLCLAGEPAVGKSSLIKRFVLDTYDDRYVATLGTKVVKRTLQMEHPRTKGPVKADMIIWDVMGTHSIRDLLKEAYYHGAHGVMAVFDLTRRETLFELDAWYKAIKTVAGAIPTYVVANKVDLVESRQVTDDELMRYCDARGWKFVTTSAKTGENVEKAFNKLGQEVTNRVLEDSDQQTTFKPIV